MEIKQGDIQNAVLKSLYEAYFSGEGSFNMHKVRESGGWAETLFWNAADWMKDKGLIKAHALGGEHIITSTGILFAEEHGIVPIEQKDHNEHVRTVVMDELAKLYEEKGKWAELHIDPFASSAGLDADDLFRNLQVLEDYGYAESGSIGSFRITRPGLEAVEKWRNRKALENEMGKTTELSPQPRGRALQKLLARVIEQHGWSQEEGVKTSNEEIDVIIFREREYYLVECKWEKDPVEANVIRELFGKLGNRVDVRGIVVSMSGYTAGAVKQSEDYVNEKVILLFGPDDVLGMVKGIKSFDELLNTKYKEFVMRRKVVFS